MFRNIYKYFLALACWPAVKVTLNFNFCLRTLIELVWHFNGSSKHTHRFWSKGAEWY